MDPGQRRRRSPGVNQSPFVENSHMILPYLTPSELAAVTGTCWTLRTVSRSSMADHQWRPQLAPPPYAYFLYSTSRTLSLPRSVRQPWPSPVEFPAGIPGGVDVRVKIVWCGRKGGGCSRISRSRTTDSFDSEVITSGEARRRQATYDELSLKDGFGSSLLVIREHLPSGTACLRMNIDATRAGNVARFFIHSCNEELTFSYGVVKNGSKGIDKPMMFGNTSVWKTHEGWNSFTK